MSFYFFLFDTSSKIITLFLFNGHLDYVGELFKFYMTLSKQQLQDACNDMKKMVPQPMNSMLDKQPREEAYNSCSPHSTIWYVFWNLKQYCLKSKVVD